MASSGHVQPSVSMAESPSTTNGRHRISRSFTLVDGNSWASMDGDTNGNGDTNPNSGPEMYPFRNFWSIGGTIEEVLFALPPKQHADDLVDAFFKYIDPSYPIISEALFRSRFEEFWALAPYERYDQLCTDTYAHTHSQCCDAGPRSTRHGLHCSSSYLLRDIYSSRMQRRLTLCPSPRHTYHAATAPSVSPRS